MQVMRDADDTLRRLKMDQPAGWGMADGLHDGCLSGGGSFVVATRSEDAARPCRSFCACGPSAEGHRARRVTVGLGSSLGDRSSDTKGDSYSAPAARQATFGDSRRQVFGSEKATGGVLFRAGPRARPSNIHRKGMLESRLRQQPLHQ